MSHGALATRLHRLSRRLGEREVRSVEDALREIREWVLSDPEANALASELFERGRGGPRRDPRYAALSEAELHNRFQARLVCAPDAHALMRIIALGPRSGGAAERPATACCSATTDA